MPIYMLSKKNLPEINPLGAGALYANGIPIIFEEYVKFISNNGSALAIHDATASFSDNCSAYFINNFAWEGGAVAMLGASQMWINPHTVFLFKNNKAELRGGAIYALQTSRHYLLTGGNCFLRYSDISVSPNKWKIKFKFENNHAPTGSSIFVTTLSSCAQGKSFKDRKFRPVLDALNLNLSDTQTIATEVFKVTKTTSYFKVIPGKRTPLPITTVDESGNYVNRSLYLHSNNKSVQVAWDITDNNFIMLKGTPNSETLLEMVTDSSHAVSDELHVKLVECPPGYYFDLDNQICRCSFLDDGQRLDGILVCDSDTFTAKIKPDYWAGYHLSPEHSTPTDSNLVTAPCPRRYCKGKEQVTPLPNISDITLLNEQFCSPGNRNGTLCGMCANGYGVAINSAYFDCINCSRWSYWISRHGWIMYILTEYIPLTLFVCFVLYFDINPHSGISSLIVLYFQIFNLFNIYSDEDVNPPKHSDKIYNYFIKFVYNIWNLDFIGSVLPSYCLKTNYNTMDILRIKYITGIIPFLLYIIIFVLHKCIHKCSKCKRECCKFEFSNGLAALCTLVFTKFAVLSGLILSCRNLSGPGSKVKVTVAWLNGNLAYGGSTHLKYMIPAVLGLILVSIIIVGVLCYPFFPKRIRSCSLFKTFQKGYREGFFIEFYAGLLFIYRTSIVFVFSFTIGAESIFFITIITLVMVVITAIAQPFETNESTPETNESTPSSAAIAPPHETNNSTPSSAKLVKLFHKAVTNHNAVAVLCFSNIVLINLISFYNLHYVEIQSKSNLKPYLLWIQLVLVVLPLLGFIILKGWNLWKKRQACWKRCTACWKRCTEVLACWNPRTEDYEPKYDDLTPHLPSASGGMDNQDDRSSSHSLSGNERITNASVYGSCERSAT